MYSAILGQLLTDLHNTDAAIEASAFITTDGLVMCSALPAGMSEDLTGAMSASVVAVGKYAADYLVGGKFEHIIIKGEHGYILIKQADEHTVITVLTKTDAQLEQIAASADAAAEQALALL